MIEIVLPDGSRREFPSGMSARELLKAINGQWAGSIIAAKVDGSLVDLTGFPPEGSRVEFIAADSPEGLQILRHSAAHLLAAAVQEIFPEVKFAIGPATTEGFYYDIELPRTLTSDDLPAIEAKMRELALENLPFVRIEVPLEEAITMVKEIGQPFKVEILEAIKSQGTPPELMGEADNSSKGKVSFYRTGNFLDLCRGPHVPDTSWLQALKLTHLAGAYWRGDERRPMLQRIYGIAFPSQDALEKHLIRLEEVKRRDHRRLGRDLDLFSIEEGIGAGLILWHPKGALVRRLIEDFWLKEHLRAGYQLVYTPHIARLDIWRKSGHLEFYSENMYAPMEVEGFEYELKPMNCPFHILIYKSHMRSYRDLPLRLAELGTVYRYERSGVLHGLLRVRGFTQDDAHIFCRPEQVREEVSRVLA